MIQRGRLRCAPSLWYEGLCSIGVDALVSIGGDDTLKTANKFKMFQDRLPAGSHRIPVVHVPKTIDNDYHGIDFTFGYFTAVDFLAGEIRKLLHDAEAARTYFLAECMERALPVGWLYGGGRHCRQEASLVLSVEDVAGVYRTTETITTKKKVKNEKTGEEEMIDDTTIRDVMVVEKVIERLVNMMITREKEGKKFGVIVLAEGIAELLPQKYLEGIKRDDHGHIAISEINLGRMIAKLMAKAYNERTGKDRKVTGLQLGYESRCAKPHAFDVLLEANWASVRTGRSWKRS